MANSFPTGSDDKERTYSIGDGIDKLGRIPVKKSVIIAICLAGFFALYDVSNFQYISPVLKSDWNLTDAQIAYAISARVIGQVIGAFCITICADFYGRKPALLVSLIILATGSILVAVSTNIFQVSIFRLITGIGIGAEVVIAAAYIGEMSPKSKRGRYTSLIFLIGTIGFADFRANFFCIVTTTTRQDDGNRGLEGPDGNTWSNGSTFTPAEVWDV